MNNKKGFTLIELIATIVLITISSTIIVINLQGSSSKEENSLAEKNDKQITDAACNAIDGLNAKNIVGKSREECKTSGCKITLEKLISNGLVDAYTTYNDSGKDINTFLADKTAVYVEITWSNPDSEGYIKKECTLHNPYNNKNWIN